MRTLLLEIHDFVNSSFSKTLADMKAEIPIIVKSLLRKGSWDRGNPLIFSFCSLFGSFHTFILVVSFLVNCHFKVILAM